MAFEIQRTQRTLPGRAGAVRADIDVDTGGQLVGRAIAGLGGALADIGMKFDLMEADTQFTEAQRLSRQEINRLSLSFEGNLDPATYQAELEKSVGTIKSYAPKNRRAARAFDKWVQTRTPQWQMGVAQSRLNRITDNFRAEGWNLKQEAVEGGDFTKYQLHLWKGQKLGAYSSEEIVKYRQYALDDRKRYTVAEEARLKREQKESLDAAQEQAASKFLVGIWNKTITDPQDVTDALEAGIITDTDAKYLRSTMLSKEPIKVDLGVYSEALKMLNDFKASPTTEGKKKLESFIIKNQTKIDETRGIGLMEDIANVGDPKAALSTNRAGIYFGALTQEYTEETGSLYGDALTFDKKYTQLRNFFLKDPLPTAKEASEFYEELMKDVTNDLMSKLWQKWRGSFFGKPYRWLLDEKPKIAESPFPEYPDAFQMGDNWYVMRDGKLNRIEK